MMREFRWNLRAGALPGPWHGVYPIRISDADRLNWNAGVESARFKSDQTLTIGTRAFWENEDLLPSVGRSGAPLDFFDGILTRVRIFPPNIDWLCVIDEFYSKQNKTWKNQIGELNWNEFAMKSNSRGNEIDKKPNS